MYKLFLHVCFACLDCLFMSPLQDEEVLSSRNPRRHLATGRVLRRYWVGVWVYFVWGHGYTQLGQLQLGQLQE